jgi:hypothetical protein
MPLRIAARIAIAAALLAVPAASQAAGVVTPSSVTAVRVVPAGETVNLSLHCPRTAVALNGAVRQKAAGTTVRRSAPGQGAGDWSFTLAAAPGSKARRASAVLRCVQLTLPVGTSRARLGVRTRGNPAVVIPAGGSTAVQLRCGAGWLGTGYGLDAGTSDDVRLAAVVPVARGWNFNVENIGSAPVTAGVTVRCLKRTVPARSGGAPTELRFRVTRPAGPTSLGPRKTSFARTCDPGQFSLATGSIVDALDSIELDASGPIRQGWGRWSFRHASGGDHVRTFLVCLSRGSTFH